MTTLDTGGECPACGQVGLRSRQMLKFTDFSAKLCECPTCTHKFLKTDDIVQSVIEAGYDHDYAGFIYDPVFATRVREAVNQDLRSVRLPPGRVLDIGCGNGVFMEAAREAGFSPRGIDISVGAIDRGKSLGLEVEVGDFLTHNFGEMFDIISMWDVIEHLRNPVEFLDRAKSLLNPGGVIVLKIPGFSNLSFSAIGVFPHFAKTVLGAPAHIQYFNRQSCEAILSRVGLDPIWFRSRPFRGTPKSTSLKRTASRAATSIVKAASGDGALFLAARAAPIS